MNSQILPLHRDTEVLLPAARENVGRRIGEVLVEAGLLTADNAQRILDYQRKSGLMFGESGIEMGLLTDEDVQHGLAMQFGHPVRPQESGLSSEVAAAWDPTSPAVEHLRVLRSQLMLRWFENDARHAALAIVSPGEGEGRSWIAANLAVLFAQLGKRTLLIDADLRRPRQHVIFGRQGRVGLSAILAGRAGADVVDDIDSVPGLSVLCAGAVPPNPQELLARSVFQKLISTLRSSYEVILVDTPAAESCADAGMVAARAGAALLVACQDRSSVPRVAGLADDLRTFGVTVVGAVLNGTPK